MYRQRRLVGQVWITGASFQSMFECAVVFPNVWLRLPFHMCVSHECVCVFGNVLVVDCGGDVLDLHAYVGTRLAKSP